MQRLAERLQQMERSVEAGGGELEDLREEVTDRDPERARSAFDEDLASMAARVGVELKTARRMDAATLSRALAGGPGSGGRLWAAAEILFVDGLAARSLGEPGVTRSRWEKAAFLYRRVRGEMKLPEDATPPEERVERFESWLDDHDRDGVD